MLLQAGNIRSAKNLIVNDQSGAITFNVAGERLNISGYLPIAEARYLLTLPSIISRVNALNSENVALLNDSIGLPQAGFTRLAALRPVTLPPNVEHLSSGQLVVEKRLMYLLLDLQKRQNLTSFYNFLRWVYLSSITKLVTLTTTVISAATANGDGTVSYDNRNVYSWTYGAEVSSLQVIDICIDELFKKYKFLKATINSTFIGTYAGDNRLKRLTEWVVMQLDSDFPEYVPFIDIGYVADDVSDLITIAFTLPPFPADSYSTTIQGDVSSEIGSGDSVSLAPNPYGDTLTDNPFVTRDDGTNPFTQLPPTIPTPDINPLTKDIPDNSLPEC